MSAPLRIVDITRTVVAVPFTPRCAPWNALLVHQWQVVEVVTVHTDAGLTGHGETLPHYTWGRVSDDAVARAIGANPAELLADDSLGAGLQMALYDLVGKALEVPVHRLLAAPQQRAWCALAWWNTDMPPDVLAQEAADAVAQGYSAQKFKARPWFDVYQQVEAVSAVTPASYAVDLDWNGMLVNRGNAERVLRALDGYERVAIYETPIPHRDVEGYRHLRARVSRPLALHFGQPPFAIAAREEVGDGFVVSGGVAAVTRHAAQAAAFDKPFWLQLVGTGLTTAFALHLGAVLSHAQWPAVTCMNNYVDDLLLEPLTVAGGYAEVPAGPGLGVQVDEEALERLRMPAPYELDEPRTLLSVVWPDGHVRHYAHIRQCWDDSLSGNLPVQARGVDLEVRHDDGSADWRELYERARRGPVHDRR